MGQTCQSLEFGVVFRLSSKMSKSCRRGNWSKTREERTTAPWAEEKMKLLRLHLIEKKPVSKICEEAGVAPTVFYRWQEQLFLNGHMALEGKQNRPERGVEQARIEK